MAEKNVPERGVAPNPSTVVDISNGKKGVKRKKSAKKGKESAKSGLPLILIILLALLIAGFYFSTFHFDVFGLRTPIFTFVHNLDPAFKSVSELEAALETERVRLETLDAELLALQDKLDTQRLQQQKQAEELLQAEKSRHPVYRPPVSDSDREYMEGIGKIYSSMDPGNAAKIMVNLYSLEDMAAILYFMSQTKAAAIMENMDAALAAQITDQLLNTYS